MSDILAHSNKRKMFKVYLAEMFEISSIHGVRYISERQLHWSERLWWLISLALSVGMCGVFINNIWTRWQEEPVTLSFTEDPISIASIPFPTVTICPEIKTWKPKFDVHAILNSFPNISYTEEQQLKHLSQVCPKLNEFVDFEDKFANESIYKDIRRVSRQLSATVFYYKWFTRDDYYGERLKIVPIITDEGNCFSFNALLSRDMFTNELAPELRFIKHINDISRRGVEEKLSENQPYTSLENEITRKWNGRIYPVRALDHIDKRSGIVFSLTILNPNQEFKCRNNSNEFRVVLTEPGEMARMSRNFYRVPFSSETQIRIKGRITITSDELRRYDVNQRQCFFASERQLRFFKIYTQSNCEMECLSNFSRIKCGCVKFSMPRDENTMICGTGKVKCYKHMEKDLTKLTQFHDTCNCLPACTSLEYDTFVERVKLDWNSRSKNSDAFHNRAKQKTNLFIAFGSNQVDTIKRIESNTVADFLAFCGGLLGLFMGISALSIVEFIFYSTIHLYWTLRPPTSNSVIAAAQQKIKENRFIRMMGKFLTELFSNSNIHGVLYFTRSSLHWTERFWWISAVCLSVWLSTTSTNKIWVKWQDHPVDLSFAEEKMSISEIPFPTVTICPEIKTTLRRLDLTALLDTNKPIKNTELRNLSSVVNIVSQLSEKVQNRCESDKNIYFVAPLYTNVSIFEDIKFLAPQLDDFIRECRFQNVKIDCAKYIVPVYTDKGYCFSFNALNSHETYKDEIAPDLMFIKTNANMSNWSISNGYEKNSSKEQYPIRVLESGRSGSLEISFALRDEDFISAYRTMGRGSKVFFTTPGDVIKTSENVFRAPLLEHTRIAIKPKFTNTSAALRSYHSNKRQCFYEDERRLRFFKKYSHSNCQDECLANLTLKVCGCVHYTLPRIESTNICGIGLSSCYRYSESNMTVEQAYLDSKNFTSAKCNCLPTCASIEYNSEYDRMLFDKVLMQKVGVVKEDGHIVVLHGQLSIYFEDQVVDAVKRLEAYTITEFMATCGGLLGLFMGVSALSIVELIYIFTLRWYWSLRRSSSISQSVPEPDLQRIVLHDIGSVYRSLDDQTNHKNEGFL